MSYADVIDEAARVTELFDSISIEQHRRKAQPQQVKNADGMWPITECVDCDDEIIPARLEHGMIRCVFCQEKLEKKEKGYV